MQLIIDAGPAGACALHIALLQLFRSESQEDARARRNAAKNESWYAPLGRVDVVLTGLQSRLSAQGANVFDRVRL